jgi:hypothetical protein
MFIGTSNLLYKRRSFFEIHIHDFFLVFFLFLAAFVDANETSFELLDATVVINIFLGHNAYYW